MKVLKEVGGEGKMGERCRVRRSKRRNRRRRTVRVERHEQEIRGGHTEMEEDGGVGGESERDREEACGCTNKNRGR